jgi:hypothetical protein
MDLFYQADAANAARLYRALQEFWGGAVPGIENAEVLRGKGKVFQFGRPPNRLDLLNSIDGVGFPAQCEDSAARAPGVRMPGP